MRTFIEGLILLLATTRHICSSDCSDYGSPGCRFLPAPPGQAPACARPGQTYCEFPSNYPGQLINKLLKEWRFDYKSLLNDETRDEYRSYYVPAKPVYGPPNTIHDTYGNVEPIHIPRPPHPTQQQPGNRYIPPPLIENYHNFSKGIFENRPYFQQELPSNQLYNYKVSFRTPEHGDPNLQHYSVYTVPNQESTYSIHDWRKRHANRDVTKKKIRRRRSSLMDAHLNNGTFLTLGRQKRQSDITGEELCRARYHFFMPRAAQNNKGNWMYIVNMPEMEKDMTQLVRSEICISQKCSGVCSLPAGYTSRCEQKYIQKRLVALRGSGDQLYTDVFWFPSCCTCTLTNTNSFVN